MTILVNGGALPPAAPVRANSFYFAVWRWHFYAGIYVIPFLLMLATTGLIMLWSHTLQGRNGEQMQVAPAATSVPVSQQADAAAAAVPGGKVTQYVSPLGPDRVALFRVEAGSDATAVQVNPQTGAVLGQMAWGGGWYDWADHIHGSLLLGILGDRLIEIAAGFGIVLVVTGLYLWWPRHAGLGRALVPDLAARGRNLWKSLHSTVGFWVAALLLAFLISGHAWTDIWGGKIVQAWSTFPAAKWDNVPLSDETHAKMNHATKEVPWGLEQTPMPASGSQEGRMAIAPGTPVTLNSVAAYAGSLGFSGRFQINAPSGDAGVWTISHDSMSKDGPSPTADRTLHLDRFTGRVLADVGFADYSMGAKAMAVGIALHEGDMGLWNLVLNTVFCLSVIFLTVSGLVMWWKRRPAGAFRLAAPPLPADLPHWKGAVVLTLLIALAFPLVGITLVAVLAFDHVVSSGLPGVKRALS